MAVHMRDLTAGPIIKAFGLCNFSRYIVRENLTISHLWILITQQFEGPLSSFFQCSYITTLYVRILHETPNRMHHFRAGSPKHATFNNAWKKLQTFWLHVWREFSQKFVDRFLWWIPSPKIPRVMLICPPPLCHKGSNFQIPQKSPFSTLPVQNV